MPEQNNQSHAQADSLGKSTTSKKSNNRSTNTLAFILVGALVFIAMAVVIIPPLLPEKANPQVLDTPTANSSTEEDSVNELPISSLATPEETPWADAQLLKARRDAQEILAELLGVQNRLESALVELWANEQFSQVVSFASEGDKLYTNRNFAQSIERYQAALDLALELDIQISDVAQQYQQKGEKLLSENQIDNAIESLQTAQQIDPSLSTRSNLLTRAQNRKQVLRLIELSNFSASDPSTLESAKQHIIDAQSLDNEYEPLNTNLASIEEKITERDYRNQMSQGYNALQQGEYELAKNAFQQAAKIKPNETASSEALVQVEAAKLNTARQRALSKAESLEASEQWQLAIEEYSKLLNEDSSLTAARLGKLRTEARLNLDKDINSIIENPLKLQNQNTWQSAQQTLSDANGILNPSKEFSQQVEQLASVLKNARTPVTVKLQSDNLTEIEVYRVGQLGRFNEQAMSLNPGNYVIVGKRAGYQDVRIELAIDGSNSEIVVPVVCDVTI